jgi:predicted nucleic acid-binding protein
MEKLKLLIDTSVVSNLYAPEIPQIEADTLMFWEDVKAGKYDVYLATTLFDELGNCPEPKRTRIRKFIAEIKYNLVDAKGDLKISKIIDEIINNNILSENSRDDCSHIACALVSGCDIIVSWNFKHMVKWKTINGVRKISLSKRHKLIDIYSPTTLIGDEND